MKPTPRPAVPSAEDILTFHPVRLHFPGLSVDALLDALNPWGGCFFVMTDGVLPSEWGIEDRDGFFSQMGKGELEWGRGDQALRIPCRLRGYSLDQEGLAAYLALRFLDTDAETRQALDRLMESLW
jgi:hypothetical protein